MTSSWSDFFSVSGATLSLFGLVISSLTLNTAHQIRNRLKDKRIINGYKLELITRKEKFETNDKFLPSDFTEQTQRICRECIIYTRRKNRKKLHARINTCLNKSNHELSLLLNEIIVELDDEGV